MECLSCGTDIGAGLGLCAGCREARSQGRSTAQSIAQHPGHLGFWNYCRVLLEDHPTMLALVVVAPIIFFLLHSALRDEVIEIALRGQRLSPLSVRIKGREFAPHQWFPNQELVALERLRQL